MLSSNTTEEHFNSARRTEGRVLYLTEIKSDIGEFSHLIDCHGVCGNNNVVSFVTNLLVETVLGIKKCSFTCVWLFQVQGYFSLFMSSHLNGFWYRWNIKTEKNLRSVLATEHAKSGLVKNCLNSIMRWLANVTILLFTRTFETWYFCFSRKAKGIPHDPFVFWYLNKGSVLWK